MKRIVLAVAILLGLATPASAGVLHEVVTAPTPTHGRPVTGGGTWIVNTPSKYYLGRVLPGGHFDNEDTSPGGWHYGRATTTINMCGWAMPQSLGVVVRRVDDSCSQATRDHLRHRRNIGRDFNAPAHEAVDGTEVPANTGCTVHYNYFYGTDFAGGANGGHWAHPAGAAASTVKYRFTTLDRRAVVVRDPVRGWGFLPINCVLRPTQLYNDDD